MAVITISRQLGSLGTTLGRQIAARLGYRLVQRELINQAAQLAGAPELALATIDELGLLGIEPGPSQQQAYLLAVQKVIKDTASQGDVIIVGRASQVVLHNWPNTLHLRVIAPLEIRVQRVVTAHGISTQAAKAQIKGSDRYRATYLKRFYAIQWDDPCYYHLVINTGFLSQEDSAQLVCSLIPRAPFLTPPQETTFE